MTQQLRVFLAKSILVLLLLPAFFSAQFAAADSASQPDIIAFEAINYFKARHIRGYSVAVIGFLNPEVELPATVELAIPAGSEIIWFSEVSGGLLADDPEFTEPFNLRTESGFDIYTVTLEHYHSVQIEYELDYNPVTQLSDGVYSIQMQYTPITGLPILRLMTNLPAETTIQDPSVEFMGEDEAGNLIFFRLYTDISPFQTVQGEITYLPPEGLGMIAQNDNLLGGIIVAIAAVLAVLAIGIGYIFFANKRKK